MLDLGLEYALGFGFGWAFFQAFAMRDMAGGSYLRSLKLTFLPEFLSMNFLMAGMVATAKLLMPRFTGSGDPMRPDFWFVGPHCRLYFSLPHKLVARREWP